MVTPAAASAAKAPGPQLGQKPSALMATSGYSWALHPIGHQERQPWQADFRTTELSSWSCRFDSGRPLHRLSPGQRMFLGHDRCPGWHPDRFMPHRVPPQALWQFILIGTALNACIFLFGMSRNGSERSRLSASRCRLNRLWLRSPDGSAQLVNCGSGCPRDRGRRRLAHPVRLFGRLLDDVGAAGPQPSEDALMTGQSSGRAAKAFFVFLYHPIPDTGRIMQNPAGCAIGDSYIKY